MGGGAFCEALVAWDLHNLPNATMDAPSQHQWYAFRV